MSSLGPILITGASGFVGAGLCRYFLDRGYRQVVALEGPSDNHWRLPPLRGPERVRMDLCSEESVRKLIRDLQPTVVLNCAAYGAYSIQTDPNKIYRVNFDAVRFLLESLKEVRGFKAFIQAGTSSEYGLNCTAPSENDATLPDSEYAVSKVAATAATQYFGKKHSLPTWVFRLYSVYGRLEETSRLIPKLLMEIQAGKLPPLVNPRISRDFVYIDDVCEAYENVIQQADRLPKGEVFNIGASRRVTLEELISCACEVFQVKAKPDWGSMANRHWDHPDWYSNSEKAMRILGWKAKTPLSEGLKATMNWMNENPNLVQLALENSILASRRT